MINYSPDVCDQLIEILKYVPKKDYEKIPRAVKEYLYSNCNQERSFIYNQALPLNKQHLSEETRLALRELFGKY